MTQAARPTQIATILEMLYAEFSTDVVASLETYITDLEARQPDRPQHIAAILKTIGPDHTAGMVDYITALEVGQHAALPHTVAATRNPAWLYWQGIKREQRRQVRLLKKTGNYR